MFDAKKSPRLSPAGTALTSLALVVTLLVATARLAAAQCTTSGDCAWPVGCGFAGSLTVPVVSNGSVVLRNLVLADRPACTPVPASGSFTISSFFDVFVEVSLNGGATWAPKAAPGAPGLTQLTLTTPPGSNPRGFDTEMLSLDISGGTLPAGMRVRESPSRASVGHTDDTSLGGGLFKIDSFFDVFVELSLDNGVTWVPSLQPTRLLLGTGNPTAVRVSTWGEVKAYYR
jgi:hypothetical protein